MKTTVIEIVDKLKSLDEIIEKLESHKPCDLDTAVEYLEEYRDLILKLPVNL